MSGTSPSRGRLFLEVALCIAAIPIIAVPSRIWLLGLALLDLQVLLRRLRTGRWLPSTPMDLPIGVLLLTAFVGLFISPDMLVSLHYLSVLVLGVATFYTMTDLIGSEHGILRAALGLILLGVGLAVSFLPFTNWEGVPLVADWPLLSNRLPSWPLPAIDLSFEWLKPLNPRATGGTMAIFLPLPLALALFGEGKKWQWLGGGAALVIAFLLVMSQSPQGLLGLIVAVALMLAWRAPWTLLAQVPLALVAWMTGWAYRWWLPEALVRRLEIGLSARLAIWPKAVMMLRDMPFTGTGLNTFQQVEAFYSMIPTSPWHAHNTWLQTGTAFGGVGLVAFAALLAAFFITTARAYRAGCDSNLRAVLVGLAGCGAAYLGYGILDSMGLLRELTIALWLMLGVVAGAGRAMNIPPLMIPRRARRVTLAVLAVLALFSAPVSASALLVNAGMWIAHPAYAGPAPTPAHLSLGEGLARRAIRFWGRNSRAYALLGEIAWLQDDPATALTAFEQAVQYDWADQYNHYRLGDLYFQQGNEPQAIVHWRAAAAVHILLKRAGEARRGGRKDDWLLWCRLAAAVDPGSPNALSGLASALQATGQVEQALAVWEKYTKRFPSLPAGYTSVARIFLQQDRAEDAQLVLERGLAEVGPDATLYLLLAQSHEACNDLEAALKAALQAAQLQPEFPQAWYRLGLLYEKQNDYDKALESYLRAASDREDCWSRINLQAAGRVLLMQGWRELAVGQYARAVAISRKMGESPHVSAQNYALLGGALVAAGRKAEAAQAYQAALELNPSNATAQEGLAQLEGKP
jgi:tetratricopeptide (TPR) repeat protein